MRRLREMREMRQVRHDDRDDADPQRTQHGEQQREREREQLREQQGEDRGDGGNSGVGDVDRGRDPGDPVRQPERRSGPRARRGRERDGRPESEQVGGVSGVGNDGVGAGGAGGAGGVGGVGGGVGGGLGEAGGAGGAGGRTGETIGEWPSAPLVRKDPAIPEERLSAEAEAHEAANSESTPVGQARPSRTRRVGRRVLQVGAVVFALLVGYFLITLLQVWSTGNDDHSEPVDAIVVMGAAQYDGRPSPQLAARLDHVVELWPDGIASVVVVTGGNQPGDRFTEAEASAAYLVDRGVPETALVLENAGSNSYDSLESVAGLLEERGLESVVIVTDPYHALRSKLIAEEVGLDAHVSSTETSVVTGADSFERHLREAAGVSVGRIIGFERLSALTD